MRARTISLNDACDIIADTMEHTAPVVEHVGETLDKLGEETNIPVLEKGGEWTAKTARLIIQLLEMLKKERIKIVDRNGSRGIKDQVLVMKVFKQIKERAH